MNWDGYADLVVGAQYAKPGGRSQAGQATVFSGKDGSVLHTFNGVAAYDQLGCSVAGAGDVNRDSFPDLIVGAHGADPGNRMDAGQATVFSGKDGSVLYTFNGVVASDYFGNSVAGAGDVDKDSFPDLIVGAFCADPGNRMDAGQATVFSGKDGSVIYTFNGVATYNGLGNSVAGAGDVNKDSFPDLIAGAFCASPGNRLQAGQATVFSGKDGSVLYTFIGVDAFDHFGWSVAGVGDVDRDGFQEVIVGAYCADPGGRRYAGQATVFSVATTVISSSGISHIGRIMTLNLTAPGDANLPYHVGSSLGTGPIPVDNRLLNLDPDNLLAVSVKGLWPSIFSGYRSTLDSKGKAKAAINIPNVPALIGLRLHTAFGVLSVSLQNPRFRR